MKAILHIKLVLYNVLLLQENLCAAFNGFVPHLRHGARGVVTVQPQLPHYNYSAIRAIAVAKRLSSSSMLQFSREHLSIDENEYKDGSAITNNTTTTTVLSQAALIAGTTIGGGFLALPSATAPCGAAPAALGLIGVWFFLLGGALSLSNAIFMMKQASCINIDEQEVGDGERLITKNEQDISIFSLIRECFGDVAGFFGGILFLLLINVTLIAQLSKVGALLESSLPILTRRVWTCLFSIIITAICLTVKQRNVERINDVLTSTMICSFTSLVTLAGGSGWRIDGLKRAHYSSLLPSSFGPWAIPVFIQLLIYNEVVPLVASRLGDEKKVRKAIILGSSVPLTMCLIWSCVALGLVPYEPSMIDSGAIYDPLTKLADVVLSKGGGSIGKLFLASVNLLAGSAICTTVIGSILASTQYFDDMISNFIGRGKSRNRGTKENNTPIHKLEATNIVRRMCTHTLAIAPSALVALYGSSDLYYRATSFAGEFPCTLLYGLIPPLCNMRLRWKHRKRQEGANEIASIISWKAITFQTLLVAGSLAILILSNSSS